MARDSSVGTATRYRLDCPGIEPLWEQDTPHPSISTLGPTQPPVQFVPGLSRVVRQPGRGVDHPSRSSAEVKERVELYSLLWTFVACYRVKFTYTETIRAWDGRTHVLSLASPDVGEGHIDSLEKNFVWIQVWIMQVPASGTFLHIASKRKVYSVVCLLCLVREQRYSYEEESVSLGNDTVSHL